MIRWICLLCIPFFLWAEKTPVVFVHLGRQLPGYYQATFSQVHQMNPEHPIYLIVHAQAVHRIKRRHLVPDYVQLVVAQSLTPTRQHKEFLLLPAKYSSLPRFWRYSMERFFILEEFMASRDIDEVLHLEGDNLLYLDLDETLPTMRNAYTGIAVPFLNDDECVPGIVYIRERNVLTEFTWFLRNNLLGEGHRSDMTLMALFAKSGGDLNCLPSVPFDYSLLESMESINGHKVKNSEMYATLSDELGYLFDPAPIGQLLDGESMLQNPRRPSIVNENAVYDSRDMPLSWEKDGKGRKVPYITYDGRKWPLANLHIHSKNLYKFVEAL